MPNTPNFLNRTLFVDDNLKVMRRMVSECIDLIYLDPPFNTNRVFNAPLGSKAAKASFDDTWSWDELKKSEQKHWELSDHRLHHVVDAAYECHSESMKAYLVFMALRLQEMHRILKDTGSIYLHCDQFASHYLKMLMDCIFGKNNFRNEIVWERHSGKTKGSQHTPRSFKNDTDVILQYSKTSKYFWTPIYYILPEDEMNKRFPLLDDDGRRYKKSSTLFGSSSYGPRPNLCYTYESPYGPVTNPEPCGWKISKEKLEVLDSENRVVWRNGKPPLKKMFADEYPGLLIGNLWDDIDAAPKSERSHGYYPTQKPLSLLRRIIRSSSKEGDLVLDPFSGASTTLVASEHLGRQWVGIEIGEVAVDVTKKRLESLPIRTDEGLRIPDSVRIGDAKSITRPESDTPDRSENIRAKLFEFLRENDDGRFMCPVLTCRKYKYPEDFELDHIRPRSKGGTDTDDNLQLICGPCNLAKGTNTKKYSYND